MEDKRYQLQRQQVRANFDRAAGSYDAVAQLQREVADRMLEQLQYERINPQRILDVGTGTGYCARGLEARFKKSSIIALDLAERMLQQAKKEKRWRSRQCFLCADTQQIPLAGQSVDLIFSNFTLQWCRDLQAVLAEFRRVLRPGGLLSFSTLGVDTLAELRESWATVDDQVHVNQFVDLQQVGDDLLQQGFAEPVTSVDRFTLTYPDVMSLMRDLKGLGATNVNPGRRAGLMGRSVLQQLEAVYQPRDEEGRIAASWEVVYGHAWMMESSFAEPQPFSLPLKEFTIPD
ncbi:MAG TPA: malonyl-ACP O-methyltransferase BioC [Gammaproteobacteria bacterium]|nr:malonyl-ACP O-methyltransferase BioC [Gammaproteobacteria bacterium]MBT6879667.1 malonyl-ACP O-methyltransferase BioC [Gammaproteobacteria bacterium]MBT7327839.1 malonyl-ACP O-methyltransferase BioC [Gammaproteobacteria bacterium]HIJ21732.1 malonyl-ACP O-methyltransferase BioC [Gammaproteobacteria bacterium]HIJ30185.1 malonyl-ACP O-methyltransferase BioC [Gammaproteobacteria bacterium]